MDIPDPYARMPWGQKVSPHHRGRRKTHFLVRTPRFSARTSMTRRVVEKLCQKKFALIFWPLETPRANGQFSGTLPWWKMAPLQRPIERSMTRAPHPKNNLRQSFGTNLARQNITAENDQRTPKGGTKRTFPTGGSKPCCPRPPNFKG